MEIFKALVAAQSANKLTTELEGRSFGCSLAVVADIEDPLKIGRIRVMLASKGAKTLTDWLFRLTSSKLVSVPLVDIGDTVVVSFINGDPNSGVYLGVLNNSPQPPDKPTYTVSNNNQTRIEQTPEKLTVYVGKSVVTISDGNITLDTGQGSLNLAGDSMAINFSTVSLNASSVTINGKSVATTSAKDTRGDSLITRGW